MHNLYDTLRSILARLPFHAEQEIHDAIAAINAHEAQFNELLTKVDTLVQAADISTPAADASTSATTGE